MRYKLLGNSGDGVARSMIVENVRWLRRGWRQLDFRWDTVMRLKGLPPKNYSEMYRPSRPGRPERPAFHGLRPVSIDNSVNATDKFQHPR